MKHQDPSVQGLVLSENAITNSAVQEEVHTHENNGHTNGYNGVDPSLAAPPDELLYTDEHLAMRANFNTIPIQPIQPIQPYPIQIARRTVSGSYSGTASGFRLDLRVDLDRIGALNTASFDFFSIGGTTTYFGSFKLTSPTITYTNTLAVIEGFFTGTVGVWANKVRISVPRNTILQSAAAATVSFFQNATPGMVYNCNFQSTYFRTVKLETDCEAGTTLLGDYNTGTFANPGPSRILNVVKAYQEAGINMVYTGANNIINTSESGADSKWTESEMHASMVRHFSVFSNSQQWQVWLFAARRATSSNLLGIMFDYLGSRPHRQGCAIFQDTVRDYHPSTNDYNRHLLYTYVHELGHAFNLLHSWDKSRPDSLSWMNYDWRYDSRNGAGSYWANFAFTFDQQEILHMRHGYRNSVIMGGNDWAVGAGLEAPHSHAEAFAEVVENNTGLKLELQPAKRAFAFGEPVVTELKLRCMDLNGKLVNTCLHPKYEYVKIAILKPNGKVVTYEPVGHNCAVPDFRQLTAEDNTAYASAYIGYGKDGFYFDQPGFYKIKAAYLHEDGSVIQSDEVTIRVKSPVTKAEDEIADHYFTNEAGMLFYLLGSDSPSLQKGMEDMRHVADKYKTNELSIYANLLLGVNDGMRFKIVDPVDNQVVTRKRNLKDATGNMTKVFDASKGEEGVDNITLNWAYRHLAKGFLLEGDDETAKGILKAMEETFKAKKLRPAVQKIISKQSAKVLKEK
ncbi:MAG: hypothetical protein K0R82_96 [Flavipsychrobacter sp.]|jgi:hypothetical protein|nr:hypothetical protein [Flavipsychrobacter sp.]